MSVSDPNREARNVTILVVEDTAVNAIMIRNILTHEGYAVRVAASADDALEILREEDGVDLIVADIGLPGMDGIELVREARTMAGLEEVPALFITGDSTAETVKKAMDVGAGGYILKPIVQPSQVLERVRQALAAG